MITIRSSKARTEVALISLEATLMTPRNVYSICSEDLMTNSGPAFGDLFGGISWPVSRCRLADGLLFEQQLFLPYDGSAVALSWMLCGNTAIATQLVVRPFFCGCGPRSYRDIGFQSELEGHGGRLTWLSSVRGPKVFADTNGRYHDEPVRLFDCFCEQAAASASAEDLITPGRFEFVLSRRPSVLIFSMESPASTQRDQHIGVFLAGLMRENSPATTASSIAEDVGVRAQQPVVG
jgi:hypothetical protein